MKDIKDDIPIKDSYIPRHSGDYKYLNKSIEPSNKVKKTITTVKKKRRIKKWVWNVIIIILVIILCLSLLKIIFWGKDNKDTNDIIEDINNDIEVIMKEDTEDTELINEPEDDKEISDYWYYTSFSLIDVDINKLKEKNSDTVGWINVNNTNVNYPFVHYKDNEFYLNHSYDKSYNDAGWVFMDYRNNINLDNKNTILYAHSRLDKSMFGSLSKVLNHEWFTNKENHIIRISTESENTLWQIFSVYKIEEESYYITTDFSSDDAYVKFLNSLSSRSIYNFSTNLNSSDRILTLSTCYSDTERTVVHAKLIKRSLK